MNLCGGGALPRRTLSGAPSPQKPCSRAAPNYLTSTTAPASVNFFLMVSASSFETPSLMLFGAPSTRSFASFRPRLVTSRTALITLILLAPTSFRTTVNSVFSSAGAAAPRLLRRRQPSPGPLPPPKRPDAIPVSSPALPLPATTGQRSTLPTAVDPPCESLRFYVRFTISLIARPGFQCDQVLHSSARQRPKFQTAPPPASR